MRYTDFIYRENIKTVKLNPVQYEFGSPIIELNSNEQLRLSFYDLDADTKLLVHLCTLRCKLATISA
ncbi:MAG: hypothetical protein IPJ79_01760 [Bacteroidetes bacterium]|nr:hypothetical protein [Bacteroidota bacterium]